MTWARELSAGIAVINISGTDAQRAGLRLHVDLILETILFRESEAIQSQSERPQQQNGASSDVIARK